MADVTEEGVALMQPKRYAIKFNPPRFILEYTDGTKIRIRSVRAYPPLAPMRPSLSPLLLPSLSCSSPLLHPELSETQLNPTP
jgi:hypothetical protein